jgi:hypothetical protein
MVRLGTRGALTAALGLLCTGCGGSDTPRTVTGTRTETFWTTSAKVTRPAWDVNEQGVSLAIRTTDGTVLSSTRFDTNGGFKFDNVPGGLYVLELVNAAGVHRFFESEADSVDLGWDVLGREDQTYPGAPTSTTFVLSGLRPATAGDVVELTASGADVWTPLIFPGELGIGVTTASVSFSWDESDLPLIDGSRGDRAWVHQLSAGTDPSSGLPYLAATAAAALPGTFAVPEGVNGTESVTLQPISQTATLSADWKLSAFETAVQDWPAGTTVEQHQLLIEALPFQVDRGPEPLSGFPDLLLVGAMPGTPDRSLSIPYGRFPGSGYAERLGGVMVGRTDYDWNGGIFYRTVLRTVAPLETGRRTVTPGVTPARGPTVGGKDATRILTGVGLTPTLSWTAPRTGSVSRTAVDVFEISSAGGFTSTEVASFEVLGTSLQIPAGLLRNGATYAVTLVAFSEPEYDPRHALAPYRRQGTQSYVSTGLAPFTP